MSFDLELNGRRALVTGGMKGAGAAVVTALVEAGARVVTTARTVPSDEHAVVAGQAEARRRDRHELEGAARPERPPSDQTPSSSHSSL